MEVAATGSAAALDMSKTAVAPTVADAPVSRTIAASWGLGHMSASAGLACLSTQFLFFMTDYVGMAPATAGVILAVAKGSDIFSDLAVGFLSDRVNTRWGRRRPWILAGALLTAIMLAIVFNLNHVPKAIAAPVCVGAVLVFYFGYTCLHVPLVAMSAEIAKDYKRAGVLWGYGMFFSMLGTNAMGTSLTAALVIWYGRDAHAYNAMSLTMAAIIILIGVSCVVGTAKAPRVSAQALKRAERPPVREWISSLVSSRSLMAYVVSETICYFATAMLAVTMTYYLFTIVRLGQVGMFTYGMTGLVGSVIGMVVVLRLMKWIPKHILSACSAIGSGCVVLGLGLLTDKSGLIPFGALVFVWGIFTLGRTLMSNALVPDLIHADFLKTGLRREGAIASITSAIQKTAPAVVTAVFSFLLAASGYIPGHPGGQQPPSAIHMIRLMNCYIPGVMLILSSLVLFFAYTLTEQRLKQIEAQADARRVAEL